MIGHHSFHRSFIFLALLLRIKPSGVYFLPVNEHVREKKEIFTTKTVMSSNQLCMIFKDKSHCRLE